MTAQQGKQDRTQVPSSFSRETTGGFNLCSKLQVYVVCLFLVLEFNWGLTQAMEAINQYNWKALLVFLLSGDTYYYLVF